MTRSLGLRALVVATALFMFGFGVVSVRAERAETEMMKNLNFGHEMRMDLPGVGIRDDGDDDDKVPGSNGRKLGLTVSSINRGLRLGQLGRFNNTSEVVSTPTAPVPEPASIFLLGSALSGIWAIGRGRRRLNK